MATMLCRVFRIVQSQDHAQSTAGQIWHCNIIRAVALELHKAASNARYHLVSRGVSLPLQTSIKPGDMARSDASSAQCRWNLDLEMGQPFVGADSGLLTVPLCTFHH